MSNNKFEFTDSIGDKYEIYILDNNKLRVNSLNRKFKILGKYAQWTGDFDYYSKSIDSFSDENKIRASFDSPELAEFIIKLLKIKVFW